MEGLIIYGGVGLLTFFLTTIFSFRSVITHDYGVLLDRIFRIYLGEFPYRDFNLPTTPLTYLIQAAVFKIFSPTVYWMKMSLSTMNTILVCGAIYTVRKFLKTPLILILLFVIPIAVTWSPGIILMHPWYDFDANFFAFFTLFSLLFFNHSEKKYWLPIAGVWCGLSILSKQNIGMGSFLSSLLFLIILRNSWKERWIAMVYFLAGTTLVAGAFGAILLWNNALSPAIDWIFVRASRRSGNLLEQAFHVVFRWNHNFVKYVFLLYAISAFLFWKAVLQGQSSARLKFGIVLYAFITVWFSCLAEGGNDYPQQQIYLSLLCPLLFGFCIQENWRKTLRNFKFWMVSLICFIMIFWPVYKNWNIPFKFGVVKWSVDTPRMKGYYFQYSDYRFVKDLLDFETHIPKNEKIFLWPDPIFFYFATDRKPLTPLSGFVITAWESPQEDNDQIRELLEAEKVPWAIIGQETYFDFGYLRFGIPMSWDQAVKKNIAMTSRGDMSKLRDYLYKNFEEVKGPVGYWALRRKGIQ